MKSYKKIEINNENYEYQYDCNFGINGYNSNIQVEYNKKIDTLLNGILSNNINKKRRI